MTHLQTRILSEVIALQRCPLGLLARTLDEKVGAVARTATEMVERGVLRLVPSCEDAQFCLSPGDPRTMESFKDPDGVIEAWCHVQRARRRPERFRTLDEAQALAQYYSERAPSATFLMPALPASRLQPLRERGIALVSDVAMRGRDLRVVVAHGYLTNAVGQGFVDEVRGLGAGVRTLPDVIAPMLHWEGLGTIHLGTRNGPVLQQDHLPASSTVAGLCYRRAAAVDDPGSRETVTRLLAAGLTDAAAARRLGISERQFRRQVATLMVELDAQSRFQAGVHAARALLW